MGLFGKKNPKGGLADVIRCDEPSYLIWKWHPQGAQPGNNKRENAIRFGSSLRVKEGEVAVFVYDQGDGKMQDVIVGPYDKEIDTANFPILAGIIGLAYNGDSPFQAEVYFINLAQIIQVKFAVPYFDVYDPRFEDFGVPVAVRGTISFHITDFHEFIKLHRLNEFNLVDFQRQISDAVSRYAKDVVANVPAKHNIPLVQIETQIAQINDEVEMYVKDRLKEDFGVSVTGVDIGVIELDKTGEGYAQLMRVTRELSAATAKAEAEAKIRDIEAKQRIEAENYGETLRIKREESQYAQHKETQSANLSAFQTEAQEAVGIAGAEALGKMGENGAGNVNLGGGSGFNMAAMAASMAVGGAVGQNIAGTMNNIMQGSAQPAQANVTPPPIPTLAFHVAVNGKAMGPYDMATLAQMAASGQLTSESLVWRNGMSDWSKAGTVEELKGMFGNDMPPIPEG